MAEEKGFWRWVERLGRLLSVLGCPLQLIGTLSALLSILVLVSEKPLVAQTLGSSGAWLRDLLGFGVPAWVVFLVLCVFLVLVSWLYRRRYPKVQDEKGAGNGPGTLPESGESGPVSSRPFKSDLTRIHSVTAAQLYGRDDTKTWLRESLSDPSVGLVALSAFAGSGKTSLVSFFLNDIASRDYEGATRIYGWSFRRESVVGPEEGSSTEFWDNALAFFDYSEPLLARNTEKACKLFELMQAHKCLLFLDDLEVLQHGCSPGLGRFADEAMLSFLSSLGREGLRSGGLVVVASRLPLPELDPFRQASSFYRCLGDQEMRLPTSAGEEMLRKLGVQGSTEEVRRAVEQAEGHALTLSLLGRYLVRECSGDVLQRHSFASGDNAALVEGILGSYELTWPAESLERALLLGLSLFQRPATRSEIEVLLDSGHLYECDVSRSTWRQVTTAMADLVDAGLVVHEGDTFGSHELVRSYFAGRFRATNPEAQQRCHGVLFDYFSGLHVPERADTLDALDSLYRAVHHGCRAGRYAEAFRNVYLPRISRGRTFYNVSALGDRSGDLRTIADFFPGGWASPGITDLDELERAWLLAKAAFDLAALGRFEDSLSPRKTDIDLFTRQGVLSLAAEDSRRLMNTLVPLGRLEEAYEAGCVAEKLAQECLRRPEFSQTPTFLELSEPEFVLEKCIAEKAYVLMLRGEHEASAREFDRVRDAREQYYRNWFLLQSCETDKDVVDVEPLIIASRESNQSNSLLHGNDTLSLAWARRRLGDFDRAEELLTEAELLFSSRSRLDSLARVLVERARLHRDRWVGTGAKRWLDRFDVDARRIRDFVRFSNALLFDIDLSLIEIDVLARRERSEEARALYESTRASAQKLGYGAVERELRRLADCLRPG